MNCVHVHTQSRSSMSVAQATGGQRTRQPRRIVFGHATNHGTGIAELGSFTGGHYSPSGIPVRRENSRHPLDQGFRVATPPEVFPAGPKSRKLNQGSLRQHLKVFRDHHEHTLFPGALLAKQRNLHQARDGSQCCLPANATPCPPSHWRQSASPSISDYVC